MAPHSSTLAWNIPWMEEPGRLQSMGSLGVGHDWATPLYFSLSCIGEGNGNPLQCSCLENLRVGGALWAAVYGIAQSLTQLKWLSSSSNKILEINEGFNMPLKASDNFLTILKPQGWKGHLSCYRLGWFSDIWAHSTASFFSSKQVLIFP